MDRAFGLEIPQTLEDATRPDRLALIVYDMQVGIMSQLPHGAEVTARVGEVLEAARSAGVRIFFMRHLSLPAECAGVFQLRQAAMWQRLKTAADVQPWFLRGQPGVRDRSRARAAPERGRARQDHDVGVRGNTAGDRAA